MIGVACLDAVGSFLNDGSIHIEHFRSLNQGSVELRQSVVTTAGVQFDAGLSVSWLEKTVINSVQLW
jgi:hypothetical protein